LDKIVSPIRSHFKGKRELLEIFDLEEQINE